MAVESGNYSTASGVYNRIITQLQNTGFMGVGNQWELVYNYDDNGISQTGGYGITNGFRVPGPTSSGDFYASISLETVTAGNINTANIATSLRKNIPVSGFINNGIQVFSGDFSAGTVYSVGDCVIDNTNDLYICIKDHTGNLSYEPTDTAGAEYWKLFGTTDFNYDKGFSQDISDNFYIIARSTKLAKEDLVDGIDYWLMANKERVMVVLRSGTRYTFMYLGAYSSFFPINYHQFPVLATVNDTLSDSSFDSLRCHNWPIEGYDGAYDFRNVIYLNIDGSSYNGNSSSYPASYWPMAGETYSKTSFGKYVLRPMLVVFFGPNSEDHQNGLYGVVEDVFLVPTDTFVSGDTLTIDSVDYLLIEDVYRGGASDAFIAIKLQ